MSTAFPKGTGRPSTISRNRRATADGSRALAERIPRTLRPGDWTGTGHARIGVFRGVWLLDVNGSRQWDGCAIDACINFGAPGDTPLVGYW